jgi:hypothetical protein
MPVYVGLLLASIIANYSLGRLMIAPRLAGFISRRATLIMAITFNLAVLAYIQIRGFLHRDHQCRQQRSARVAACRSATEHLIFRVHANCVSRRRLCGRIVSQSSKVDDKITAKILCDKTIFPTSQPGFSL